MYIKFMSSQNLPDCHLDKDFKLVECVNARVVTEEENRFIEADLTGDWLGVMRYLLEGVAYFINADGKTIARTAPLSVDVKGVRILEKR